MATARYGWGKEAALRVTILVPIVVGVAGKGDLEVILQTDQPLHGVSEDGSMRIWPSQSAVINRKVGSTASLTTVRFSL